MSRNSQQQQQQQPAFVVFNDEEEALLDVNTAFLIKSPGGPSSSDDIKTPTNESVTQQLFGENDFENTLIDLRRDIDDDDNEVVRTDSNFNDNDVDNNDDDDDDDTNSEERRRRFFEEQQSIELARQLMAEEAMLSYHQHVQYLRESANELSQEDYDALQRALQEDMVVVEDVSNNNNNNNDDDDEINSILDNNGGRDEEDDDDDNNNNEADLSYETMLYLSERIGDVKTERWTMIAQREINKLPKFQYSDTTNSDGDVSKTLGGGDSEHKCLICQCDYECGEELIRLPCHHAFHKDCVAHWLSTKDVCPYCRQCIVSEREQN